MVKRGAVYFVVFGPYCCFCAQGSGAIVHTASSPLGPYTAGTDIQVAPAEVLSRGGGSSGKLTIPSQQSFTL
jgi:hypothetical protein